MSKLIDNFKQGAIPFSLPFIVGLSLAADRGLLKLPSFNSSEPQKPEQSCVSNQTQSLNPLGIK